MAKPEWGSKRVCLSCGSKFYDLGRLPIICPSCETTFQSEDFQRTKRTRPSQPTPEAKKPAAVSVVAEGDDEEIDKELEIDEVESDDDQEDGLIEDTSDLGEDDNDVAGVIEKPGSDEDET